MDAETGKHSRIGLITAMLPLGLLVALVTMLPKVAAGHVYRVQLSWIPSLGISLSIMIDGLSLLFGVIICCVGFFVTIYAADYLPNTADRGRFFIFLHGFLLAMLGLVFADNLLGLFVFWELTTIISYLLIGFENESSAARKNARQALLVTGTGGIALLVGFLLIGNIAGTYDISQLPQQSVSIRKNPLYMAILLMVLLGAFTKSAQIPFHFWLPNAMTAPTPISAFLHSATMVKAGIYLLARMHPVLGGTFAWMGTLVVVGGVTALLGAVLAIKASDLKRLLAYTTITALGMLTMFLGGKTTPALTAAITFLMVHSLYKSSLFLVVGIVDHQAGTRQIGQLGGLLKSMPITAVAAATAALSMAGFPLFFGFIGKEIMYKGALTEDVFPVFATAAAVIANSLMTALAGVVIVKPFLGKKSATPLVPREASVAMCLGPVFMGLLGLVFGVVPDWVGHWIIEPAVRAIHPSMEDIELKLFYGFNEPLLLSILTLSFGSLLYLIQQPLQKAIGLILKQIPLRFESIYTGALNGIAAAARTQTAFLQNGSLHRYLCIIIGSVIVGVGLPFLTDTQSAISMHLPEATLVNWLVVVIICLAVVGVVISKSRLLAICCLGVVGADIALLFLIYGAPDVALTQLLVETLTVIIVALVLLRLPDLNKRRSVPLAVRWGNAVLAVSIGTMISLLIMAVNATELNLAVTKFFETNSYLAAHGRNIVNVILVDFRSLDTLGEITVVALAGLAGYALIKVRKVE